MNLGDHVITSIKTSSNFMISLLHARGNCSLHLGLEFETMRQHLGIKISKIEGLEPRNA